MVLSALVVGAMALGMTMLRLTSNPQTIWVPPDSRTSQQQTFFNNAFDPFYRIEQVIFTPAVVQNSRSILDNNVLTPEILQVVDDFQRLVAETADSAGTKLDDVCYKPVAGKGCIVESVTNFAGDNRTVINATTPHGLQSMLLCRAPPAKDMRNGVTLVSTPCTSGIGVPAMPAVAIGSVACTTSAPGAFNDTVCKGSCPGKAAQAVMTTWLLNDGPEVSAKAARWEKEVFLPLAQAFQHPAVAATYMAQRSVNDELATVVSSNTFVVLVSYGAMFAYIVVAMGKFPHPVRSRALLGLGGIFLVLLSTGGAIGLWSYGGGSITMIVTEVVPFLILAIGVDNMFIITKTADRIRARRITAAEARRKARCAPKDPATPMTVTSPTPATPVSVDEEDSGFVPVHLLLGDVMAEVGPTITAAAAAEALAFLMGAATSIPALSQFCAVAAIAVLLDYAMQMTFFLGAVALDLHRQDNEAPDCLPCLVLVCERPQRRFGWCGTGTAEATVAGRAARKSLDSFWAGVHRGEYVRAGLAKLLAPVLLSLPVRLAAVAAWLFCLGLSGYAASTLSMGMAQQLAVPQQSYLYDYFNHQAAMGDAGPPAYVVLQNVNYSDADDRAKVGIEAVATQLSAMTDHIVPPVFNWYGLFRAWSSVSNIDEMRHDGSTGPTYRCPLPLYPTNHSLGERVEQFLYDIPIDSPCCKRKAHCYAQYGGDVKLLWVSNASVTVARLATTTSSSSGGGGSQQAPLLRAAASLADAPGREALLARASAALLVQAPASTAAGSDGEAPWLPQWWADRRWQPASESHPVAAPPAQQDGMPLASGMLGEDGHHQQGSVQFKGVMAGSRADATSKVLVKQLGGASDGARAIKAAAEAAEAWRVAAVAGGVDEATLLAAVVAHKRAVELAGEDLVETALRVAASLTPVTVMTSRLRTLHTALRDQTQFVTAMQATQGAVHRLAHLIPTAPAASLAPPGTVVDVNAPGQEGNFSDNQHTSWLKAAPAGPNNQPEAAFPYSLFYVYYEQYDYIRGVALGSILSSLGAAYLAVLLVTSPAVAAFVAVMVLSVATQVVGFVWLLNPAGADTAQVGLAGVGKEVFGVQVNAVSVVNLVTAVGLAVEFNVHIASRFAAASGTRIVRARKALTEMGSAVVTGITLTKLVGVLVLGWAPSQIFRLYYFRMYMGIIVAGFFQGLIVLPALLSFCGPPSVHRADYVQVADEDEEESEAGVCNSCFVFCCQGVKGRGLRPRRAEEYRGRLASMLVVPRDDESLASEDSNHSRDHGFDDKAGLRTSHVLLPSTMSGDEMDRMDDSVFSSAAAAAADEEGSIQG